jgi:hypothetical protein
MFTSTDTRLHVDTAILIAKSYRTCDFTSIIEISIEAAEALSLNWHYDKHSDVLTSAEYKFDGLTCLTPELVSAFSKLRGGSIKFNGIKELTVDAAKAVALLDCSEIELNGLETLSVDVAKELINFPRKLWDSKSKIAARMKQSSLIDSDYPDNTSELDGCGQPCILYGELHLNGLINISPEVASALSCSDRVSKRFLNLFLNGFQTISDEVLRRLIQFHGTIYLHGLRCLSTSACKIISKNVVRRNGASGNRRVIIDLPLSASVQIPDKGWMYLIAAARKVRFTYYELDIPEKFKELLVHHYVPRPDFRKFDKLNYIRRYIKRNYRELNLDTLDELSVAHAHLLARSESLELHLNSITVISNETILILSGKKWSRILLNNLQNPQPELFLILAPQCEEISLLGIKKLEESIENMLMSNIDKFLGLSNSWKKIRNPKIVLPDLIIQDLRNRNQKSLFSRFFGSS